MSFIRFWEVFSVRCRSLLSTIAKVVNFYKALGGFLGSLPIVILNDRKSSDFYKVLGGFLGSSPIVIRNDRQSSDFYKVFGRFSRFVADRHS